MQKIHTHMYFHTVHVLYIAFGVTMITYIFAYAQTSIRHTHTSTNTQILVFNWCTCMHVLYLCIPLPTILDRKFFFQFDGVDFKTSSCTIYKNPCKFVRHSSSCVSWRENHGWLAETVSFCHSTEFFSCPCYKWSSW